MPHRSSIEFMGLANQVLVRGRLGRAGFWLRHLIVLPFLLWAQIAADEHVGQGPGLAIAIATSAVLVLWWGRRLHDRGRSAWWLLLVAVPLLGALALLIECALRRGQPGLNRFDSSATPIDYFRVQSPEIAQ